MKIHPIFLLILISAVFLSGCVGTNSTEATKITEFTENSSDEPMVTPAGEDTPPSKPYTVPYWREGFTLSDDGRVAHTKYGETVRIELEGNAGTGPIWKIDGGGLPALDDPNGTYIPSVPEYPDAGGVYAFAFDTVDPGIYTITGKEIRPGEKNETPVSTFRLRVQVTTMVPP